MIDFNRKSDYQIEFVANITMGSAVKEIRSPTHSVNVTKEVGRDFYDEIRCVLFLYQRSISFHIGLERHCQAGNCCHQYGQRFGALYQSC